jgi:hypothetical protein
MRTACTDEAGKSVMINQEKGGEICKYKFCTSNSLPKHADITRFVGNFWVSGEEKSKVELWSVKQLDEVCRGEVGMGEGSPTQKVLFKT